MAFFVLLLPTPKSAAQPGMAEFQNRLMLQARKLEADYLAQFLDQRANPNQVNTWGIRDAVRLDNGRTIYLRDYYGPGWWDYAEEELEYMSWVNTREYKRYQRIFHDPNDNKNIYAISAVGESPTQGHTIYRHPLRDGVGEKAADFREPITKPEYLITKNSTAFIYGRNGLIYRWNLDDGLSRWQIDKPDDIQEKRRNMFSRLRAIEMGNAVCFYSHIDSAYPKKELRDLLIFESQKPRRISLRGKTTGPAYPIDASTIRFCHNSGFLDVNIQTGEQSESKFVRPTADNQNLILTHYFYLPSGKQIGLWRKPFRSFRRHDVDSFEHGHFDTFATFEPGGHDKGAETIGHWLLHNQGRNRLLYAPDHVATDQNGGIWMSTSEGALKHIAPDGELHSIRFGPGFGFGQIDFMKHHAGSLVVVDQHADTLSFIDTDNALESSNQLQSEWSVFYSRIPLEWDKQNRMVLFSVNRNEGLIEFERGQRKNIPLPAQPEFDSHAKHTVTRDSNNEYWIFQHGKSNKDRTFWRHSDSWKMFSASTDSSGARLSSKEVAFQSRLESVSPGYVIGRRFNQYRVSFGADRKIVFANERNGISYFNGQHWLWTRDQMKLPDGSTLEQQPFFMDGVTTIYASEHAWSLTDEQWEMKRSTRKSRPWNKIEAVAYPFEGEQYYNTQSSYPDGPFSEEEADWGYRASNITCSFVRAHDKLGIHYPSGVWNVLPAKDTPFENNSSFESIWVDSNNRWFFTYPVRKGIHKFVIYEPKPIALTAVQTDLGTVQQPFVTISPRWQSSTELEKVKSRFRIGNEDWSEWVSGNTDIKLKGFEKPGKYVLELQLFSESRPMRSHSLKYEFTINYDLGKYLKPIVEDLKSDEYQVRREAAGKIYQTGKAAIPFLKGLLRHDNAEIRMTAEMMIKLLESYQTTDTEKNEDEQ